MRTDKKYVLIVRIKGQGPDPLTRQMLVFWIDARPRLARVRAAKDSAANVSLLVRIADENLIAIARIDQNAGEVAVWKIHAADFPRSAAIMRHVQRLLRADINVIGPLRILRYRVHCYVVRYAINLPPGLSTIARNENSRIRRADPDSFRVLRIGRDARRARIKRAIREFLPTLGRIETAIKTRVCCCQNRWLLSFRVNRADQSVDCISDNQV